MEKGITPCHSEILLLGFHRRSAAHDVACSAAAVRVVYDHGAAFFARHLLAFVLGQLRHLNRNLISQFLRFSRSPSGNLSKHDEIGPLLGARVGLSTLGLSRLLSQAPLSHPFL